MYPKLSQYPRELRIQGKRWKIRFCRRIPGEPMNTLGLCVKESRMIYIRLGQSPKDRFESFWHEVIHSAEFSAGCSLNHRSVYKIEKTLAAAFVENFVPMCELAFKSLKAG